MWREYTMIVSKPPLYWITPYVERPALHLEDVIICESGYRIQGM